MAAGDPTGGDLASGTTNGDTLAVYPSYTEREISLGAGVALTSGTQYAIVVRAVNAGADLARWAYSIPPNNTYANGLYVSSTDSGSSWSQDSDIDLWFKTKASAVEKDSHTAATTFPASIGGVNWFAMTFTASSSYTIDAVVLKLGRTGTPGTITVGIRATAASPTKATNPSPTDANTSVTLDQATISWTDGGGADTFDVYYGTVSGSLTKVSTAQAGTSFTVTGITDGSPYSYLSVRYWRIDSTNDAGTTTGDELVIHYYSVQTSRCYISL
jgi:hypothetical protein